MCNKAVSTYPSTTQLVPDRYKTHDKTVNICPFVFDSVLYWYFTQELCDKFVPGEPFILKYCHDKCKT